MTWVGPRGSRVATAPSGERRVRRRLGRASPHPSPATGHLRAAPGSQWGTHRPVAPSTPSLAGPRPRPEPCTGVHPRPAPFLGLFRLERPRDLRTGGPEPGRGDTRGTAEVCPYPRPSATEWTSGGGSCGPDRRPGSSVGVPCRPQSDLETPGPQALRASRPRPAPTTTPAALGYPSSRPSSAETFPGTRRSLPELRDRTDPCDLPGAGKAGVGTGREARRPTKDRANLRRRSGVVVPVTSAGSRRRDRPGRDQKKVRE